MDHSLRRFYYLQPSCKPRILRKIVNKSSRFSAVHMKLEASLCQVLLLLWRAVIKIRGGRQRSRSDWHTLHPQFCNYFFLKITLQGQYLNVSISQLTKSPTSRMTSVACSAHADLSIFSQVFRNSFLLMDHNSYLLQNIGYGMGDRGSIPSKGKIFLSIASRPALRPTPPPIQ
jgi:hypothetical protein